MNRYVKFIVFSIILLAIISCGISITNKNVYQDGEWANAQWLGQDVVTLFIAAPMLYLSYIKAFSKKLWKWNMVFAGILFYFVYTYAFFAFVAKLTFLYFLHLPIFGLSILGLFLTLSHLFQKDYKITVPNIWLKRGIIIFLLLIVMMLSFLWLSDAISHLTISGYKSDTPNGEPPLIVYSLDLGLVVPLMLLAAIGYGKKKQYGYKLTGVMLTKSATIGFALMAMSLSMYLQDLNPDVFLIILWCFIGILGSILTLLYLRNLKKSD